jgi:hypothetical protein
VKQILAYAILIIGFPHYLGLLLGGLLVVPVGRVFPYPLRLKVVPFLSAFNGLIAIFLALMLFRLFGLICGLWVLVISILWISLYFYFYRQSRIEWVSYIAGITAGWVIFKDLFQAL